MSLISNYVVTLKEAITLKRVLAIPIIITLVTGTIKLIPLISFDQKPMLLGTPAIIWGVITGLIVLCYFLVVYANRLRLSLVPKMELYFRSTENGIVETPLKVYAAPVGGDPVFIEERRCIYIRFHIKTLTNRAVLGCHAFITKIEKRNKDAEFSEIPLSFPLRLTKEPVNIYPSIHQPVDFLKCDESENVLKFSDGINWPLTIRNIFADKVTYLLTITVTDGDLSQTIKIEVHWNGSWDQITAKQV